MLIKTPKPTEYDLSFTCDICKEAFDPTDKESFQRTEEVNQGVKPEFYQYHFHTNCLFEFWKSRS